MQSNPKAHFILLLCLALLSDWPQRAAQLETDCCVVSQRTSKEQFKTNELVTLYVSFKNTSDLPVSTFESAPLRDFQVEVWDQRSKAVPLTNLATRVLDPDNAVLRMNYRTLPPGQVSHAEIELNLFYDIRQSGQYSTRVSCDLSRRSRDVRFKPGPSVVRSGISRFTIREFTMRQEPGK